MCNISRSLPLHRADVSNARFPPYGPPLLSKPARTVRRMAGRRFRNTHMTKHQTPDLGDAKSPAAGERRPVKELLLPRLLVSLISLTTVGLGTMALLTQSYSGRTTKLGGAEVWLHGGSAIAMGLATIFLGLIPLALWFTTRRPALVWALACASAAALSFCISAYGAKP